MSSSIAKHLFIGGVYGGDSYEKWIKKFCDVSQKIRIYRSLPNTSAPS